MRIWTDLIDTRQRELAERHDAPRSAVSHSGALASSRRHRHGLEECLMFRTRAALGANWPYPAVVARVGEGGEGDRGDLEDTTCVARFPGEAGEERWALVYSLTKCNVSASSLTRRRSREGCAHGDRHSRTQVV